MHISHKIIISYLFFIGSIYPSNPLSYYSYYKNFYPAVTAYGDSKRDNYASLLAANTYIADSSVNYPTKFIPAGWTDPKALELELASDMVKQCIEQFRFPIVKLNPAQNEYPIDSDEVIKIVEIIVSYGAIPAFHYGADTEYTSAEGLEHIASHFKNTPLIAVHMGGQVYLYPACLVILEFLGGVIAFVLYGSLGFSIVQLFRVFEEIIYYAIGFPISNLISKGKMKAFRIKMSLLSDRPIILSHIYFSLYLFHNKLIRNLLIPFFISLLWITLFLLADKVMMNGKY